MTLLLFLLTLPGRAATPDVPCVTGSTWEIRCQGAACPKGWPWKTTIGMCSSTEDGQLKALDQALPGGLQKFRRRYPKVDLVIEYSAGR